MPWCWEVVDPVGQGWTWENWLECACPQPLGQEEHLYCWNVVYKQESLCCPWKLIKGFPVPLSSLESQPYLPRVWALVVVLLRSPLSSPLQPLLSSHLGSSTPLCAGLIPSVTGDHSPVYGMLFAMPFSGPESPLSLLTALSGRSHIPCLIGN